VVFLFIRSAMQLGTIILSVYLFIVSLAPNFGGSELLKLPVLIQHYLQHCNGPDSDFRKDTQLPFKSMDAMIHSHVVVIPFVLPEFSFKPVAITVNKLYTPLRLPILTQMLASIWQPPKA
jgi:hypothetical protein